MRARLLASLIALTLPLAPATPAAGPVADEKTVTTLVEELIDEYGISLDKRIKRGIRQVAERWWLEDGDKESFWVNTFTGQTKELAEYLSYAYFVTSGKLGKPTTGGPPNVFVTIKGVNDVASDWTPRKEGDATLWVVVRDGRGGASWISREVRVNPGPP